MRTNRKRRTATARARLGASVVEFAVVAPVLFVLLFGIIEFGRLMMVQQAMTNAARDSGRKASLATTLNATDVDTTARTLMRGVMVNASDAAKVRINITPADLASVSSGTPVTVAIAINFSDVGWLPATLLNLSGGRALGARSTFYRE
jgi:Flp pilus assembly protein TadG